MCTSFGYSACKLEEVEERKEGGGGMLATNLHQHLVKRWHVGQDGFGTKDSGLEQREV